MIDCLVNGFLNLVYVAASGGLICTLPMNSKRRIPIQDSSEHGQLPWSPKSRLSCGQVKGPTMLAEPSADPIEAETRMLSIPQAQLARRYQELARVLKNQGLPAEAKSTWIHALDLLTRGRLKPSRASRGTEAQMGLCQ